VNLPLALTSRFGGVLAKSGRNQPPFVPRVRQSQPGLEILGLPDFSPFSLPAPFDLGRLRSDAGSVKGEFACDLRSPAHRPATQVERGG
jgi:hypothetical protein